MKSNLVVGGSESSIPSLFDLYSVVSNMTASCGTPNEESVSSSSGSSVTYPLTVTQLNLMATQFKWLNAFYRNVSKYRRIKHK